MNKRYACFLGLLVVCLFALSPTLVNAQNSKIRSDLSRSFTKFDLVKPAAAHAKTVSFEPFASMLTAAIATWSSRRMICWPPTITPKMPRR